MTKSHSIPADAILVALDIAKALRKWIQEIGVQTAYIEKESPPENGFMESFNARLRDELLNGEIFYTLSEAQVVVEAWRRHFNAVRPHSSLKGRPPAPESITFPPCAGDQAPVGNEREGKRGKAGGDPAGTLTLAADRSVRADQEHPAHKFD